MNIDHGKKGPPGPPAPIADPRDAERLAELRARRAARRKTRKRGASTEWSQRRSDGIVVSPDQANDGSVGRWT